MESDGTGGDAPPEASIAVTGKRFVSSGMGGIYEGTVRLGENKAPKTIDLEFTAGHATGTRNLGIYKLVGDTWTLCLATRGDDRPKKFSTAPDTGHVLEIFTRT